MKSIPSTEPDVALERFTRRVLSGWAVLSCLLVAGEVLAADAPAIHARRAVSRVVLDGKLDDAAWGSAPAFDQFVETFPQDRAAPPPDFRTEVKVLYDDEFLYVGVRCFDPDPHQVARQLSRRDTLPSSDYVELALDPTHQGNTGYDFIVNAAGVQRDQLLYADVNATDSWDAVWDGSANVDGKGWTAELAISLRVLRFPQQESQVWGINVRRVIPRTHQTFASTYVPRNANPINAGGQVVSRFGPLVELIGLEPKRDIELAPYAAVRLTSRPMFSDPNRPTPSLLDPSADLGLDLKSALTSSLNLSVAVNPDFGQVEADQIIQNVSTNEQFFPEKRPFFTQGLDLFQPVGAEYGSPQQLFYSRRIGLEAPILGAAKLTGSVREGTELGVLDVMVMGAGNPSLVPAGYMRGDLSPYEATPDRRWQYHLTQPLHFGPNDALPSARPVSRNHFAAVLRQQVGAHTRVGATFTSAVPLAPRCRPEEFATQADYEATDCSASGTNAAALDFTIRSENGEWGGLGQIDASQAVGGPPEGRMLRDGTVLRAGDLGYGGYFRLGKLGGEPFRFDINGTFETAKLDLNDSGFQPLSNYQWYDAILHFVRPSGFGQFHSFSLDYVFDIFNWSADGRATPRGSNQSLQLVAQLPSFDTFLANVGIEQPQFDTREIPHTGIAVERASDVFLAIGMNTDSNRPLFGTINLVGVRILPSAPVPAYWGWQINSSLTWHPTSFLETYLAMDTATKELGARYVLTDADQNAIFGAQRPAFFSMTLRQQVVLTPRLTLQAYAQLFSGSIRYSSFFLAPLPGRERLPIQDLVPIDSSGNFNDHFSALNLNLVLRWEYRLGSTLYAVYTRSQQELPAPGGVPSESVFPSRLTEGPVTQTVLVKWSYWWDV